MPGQDSSAGGALVLYPTAAGYPVRVCNGCWPPPGTDPAPASMRWTPDREFLYLRYGIATYAIPLRPGELRPPIPASGFPSKEGVAALPGGRLVADRDVYPGPNPSIHAFVEGSAQRNIYRVPLQ